MNGDPSTVADSVFASIMPTICLVKLMPLPHEDGNDTAQSTDSQRWSDWFLQAEWYLRAMCEGYVVPRSSSNLGCNISGGVCIDTGLDLYDYTFENLMLDATGGSLSSMVTMPTVETDHNEAADVVVDPWPTYGPMPTLRQAQRCSTCTWMR